MGPIGDEEIARRYSLRSLERLDFFSRVRPLVDSGTWRITPAGKIARARVETGPSDPWVRLRRCPRRVCMRHHEVIFQCFGVIPRFCFDCYKVVIRPRTVVELFKLLEVLGRLPPGIPCKCGAERRTYINADYGGIVYALGAEEGRERLRLAATVVAEGVSPAVPVTLRRGCSEFEIQYGPGEGWRYRPAWGLVERWVDEHFEFPAQPLPQPVYLREGIMRGWIEHARRRGDQTYLVLTGGEPLPETRVDAGNGGDR